MAAVLVVVAGACSSDSAHDVATPTTGETADDASTTTDGSRDPETEPDAGGEPTARPGQATLLDAGGQPRVTVGITGDADATISVSALDERTATVDGTTTNRRRTADYDLSVEVVAVDDRVELLVAPTIVDIDGPAPTADEIGTLRWLIDPYGLTERIMPVRSPGPATSDTLALFNVPNLVVTVPGEPVGPGARWSQPLEPGTDAQLLFTLNDIDSTELDITIELVAPVDGGTLTIEASGRYDRSTLLAREVTAVSTLAFDAPVTADGEPAELTGVWRSERTYTEVAG